MDHDFARVTLCFFLYANTSNGRAILVEFHFCGVISVPELDNAADSSRRCVTVGA